MPTLAVQEVRNTALTPTDNAADAGGDEFTNNPGTLVHIANGHSSPQTVTFTAQKASVDVPGYGSLSISNIAVAVTNAEERVISIPTTGYNDVNGRVQMTYSGVTLLLINIFRALSQ